MSKLVLVTGITGYIAKHTALQLLQAGFEVRGSLRSLAKGDQVKSTLERHGADTSKLSFVEGDLTKDQGWAEACQGCSYVLHLASPFPLEQPNEREALVPMARDGALRVLRAASSADVERVVFTSSLVSVMYRANRPARLTVGESDWTDPDWGPVTPYIISKTRAERAAWDWAEESGFKDRLTVVNPGFVQGPALDKNLGTSLEVIRMMLSGAYPAVPRAGYPMVDVRDLSALLVAAMEAEGVQGRRLLAASDFVTLIEMASHLREKLGAKAKKAPKFTLPDFVVKFVSKFDKSLQPILPELGVTCEVDNQYVTKLTGIEFRSGLEATLAAAESLYAEGVL